jgi:tryptophan synthase alpha chain
MIKTRDMSERLNRALRMMRGSGKTGVIPYVTIGFPTVEDTLAIVPALEKAGATLIELGVPYSDPLAEGPTIQSASYAALKAGMTMHKCIETARQLRESGVTVPLIFMGYYNPILNYGLESYTKDCADAGVDGFIIPDLPLDEAEPFHDACRAEGLALVSMLAPTSTDERIALGAASSDGFVYCVSVAGVTGARSELPATLPDFIARVKSHTTLPVVVGFGISERSHVQLVGLVADAAAVGSALINVIESAPAGERAEQVAAFIAALVGNGAKNGASLTPKNMMAG